LLKPILKKTVNGGPSDHAQKTVERILIIKLDEIGDVILASPAIRFLRQSHPLASITLVVNPLVYPLVEHCPYVDRVLAFERMNEKDWRAKVNKLWRMVAFCWRNRLFRYDLSIVLRTQPYSTECLLARVSYARQRLGWDNPRLQRTRRSFSTVLPVVSGAPEVQRLLAINNYFEGGTLDDGLELWLGDVDVSHLRIDGHRRIIVGCNIPKITRRSWPIERYATLINRLHESDAGLTFVVVGGPADRSTAEELIQRTGHYVKSYAGQLSLRESCALMKDGLLFIGNDSGPMHMAAASGVPVVEVSCHVQGGDPNHANAPERFGPYGVPHRICRPDKAIAPCIDSCTMAHAHCITGVTVEQVYAAAVTLLSSCCAE
jgi:heptosyltransferase-2